MRKRQSLKQLNTPEPKRKILERLFIERMGKQADVTVGAALEFRRDAYGLGVAEFAFILGIPRSHYNEIINGRRDISKHATRRAYAIGVPADVLLQPFSAGEKHG